MSAAQLRMSAQPFSLHDRNVGAIAYLLRRAGFGATPAEIQAVAGQELGEVISSLIAPAGPPDTFTPPPASILGDLGMDMVLGDFNQLTVWWLNRMLTTTRPLGEKMTLFWHGHFASGFQKVRSALLMYQQNQIFRNLGMGRFDDLLSAVYKDPAMLWWLDGQSNTKLAPNENWGREVLELFTIGPGNYTEDDVHANSRAFTGWRINRVTAQGELVPRLHDPGVKTLLGQTGPWDGEDAVRIMAAHPATGTFLARKLWRFFASDQIPTSAIDTIAQAYYDSNHQISAMVRTLFTRPEFYAAPARQGHIKSPTEFVLTSLRQLGITNMDLTTIPRTLATLGQELFNPPNVGGWPAGPTWINASTMLGRFNFASYLTGDVVRARGSIDPQAVLTRAGLQWDDALRATAVREIRETLIASIAAVLGLELSASTHTALMSYAQGRSFSAADMESTIRGLIHLALVSPEYQAS